MLLYLSIGREMLYFWIFFWGRRGSKKGKKFAEIEVVKGGKGDQRGKMRKSAFLTIIFFTVGVMCFSMPGEAIIAEYLKKNISPTKIIDQFNNQLTLGKPQDLFIDKQGNLYVIDLYHQAIFIYDDHYQSLTRLDVVNGLRRPIAVAADSQGNIYVSDAEQGILVFNSIGKMINLIELTTYTEGQVQAAADLCLDQAGNLFLATGTVYGVMMLNPKGRLIKRIITQDVIKEKSPPEPVSITCLNIDEEGKIYLVSEEVGRIYVYKDADTFLFSFGQKGGSFGKLSRPVGIAVDNSIGLVYLLDYMRHTISIYNINGIFLQEYGGLGKEAGWFHHPTQICLDKEHQLVIADTFNHRIQILAVRQ